MSVMSACIHCRHSEVKYPEYRSRQSLNSPSPGGTEMDLLVMRERPRKGIRNSGYDVSNANLLIGTVCCMVLALVSRAAVLAF